MASNDLDPRPHRLQRQDAKSRKTFKRKRTKTTSMRRYLPRRDDGNSDPESQSLETSPTHRTYSYRNAEQDIARLQQARAALSKTNSPSLARSEEMIAETVEMKVQRMT